MKWLICKLKGHETVLERKTYSDNNAVEHRMRCERCGEVVHGFMTAAVETGD